MLTTGRVLDNNRQPINGTGFEYDSEGRLAELISQRISPVYSNPQTGEWVLGLITSDETNGEFERGLGIFHTGNSGPPAHFHPIYDQHFEIVQGEFVFTIAGKEQTVGAGEQIVIEKGTPHTFRCVGDKFGASVVETRPAGKTAQVITTLFGLAHEGKLTLQGNPKFLQAMLIASEFASDTVFTSSFSSIAIPIAKMVAPIARVAGYRVCYDQYEDDSFWYAHVEQPK